MTHSSSEPSFETRLDHPYPAHAKIVATLGPASESPAVLRKLIEAGVNVFRLNFSHGSLDEQKIRLDRVREAAAELGRTIGVLGDLQGPKMRVGKVPDLDGTGGLMLETGQDVVFLRGHGEAALGDGGLGLASNGSDEIRAVFGTTFDAMYEDVEPGQRVLVNDGAIRMLAVAREQGEWIRCRVTHGGKISSSKGINLPETQLNIPAITDRDWNCVEWAVQNGLDFLALSFVRTADEVRLLKVRLDGMCAVDPARGREPFSRSIPVISKIEKPQALRNLRDILDASDGVMVARGDLGVEMDVFHVPVAQKHIVAMAASYGKPCIVATQMLETMIVEPLPTRAEASDVANAIFDGADAVMLSAETAAGRHPDLVVETMARIVRAAEDRIDQLPHEPIPPEHLVEYPYRSAALATGAWHIAKRADAKLVVVWSQGGGMARYLSGNDFRVPILAWTSSAVAARRMTLLGGVTPILSQPPADGSLAGWTDEVETLALERGWAKEGDAVVLIAGKPLGGKGAQDILAILRVGDKVSGFRKSDHTA